jgi:hypothetical protein
MIMSTINESKFPPRNAYLRQQATTIIPKMKPNINYLINLVKIDTILLLNCLHLNFRFESPAYLIGKPAFMLLHRRNS